MSEEHYEFECEVDGPNGEPLMAEAEVTSYGPGLHAPMRSKCDPWRYSIVDVTLLKLIGEEGEPVDLKLDYKQEAAIEAQITTAAEKALHASVVDGAEYYAEMCADNY